MIKINLKKIILCSLLATFIFALDRFSKLYILNLAEINNFVDIYLTSFFNLYLIWNKGIAFGILSFDQKIIYNFITGLIIFITLIIFIITIKSQNYKIYFYVLILSGSLGNIFDRVYYQAVPDFIDFHINDFHWFVFNVADIFITLGIICLIFAEIFFNKKV
tara:strand:- start:47 stop:532 length:486 start_codon:yes stop_codon:yes gene_type:complete